MFILCKGLTGTHNARIYSPVNETTYYAVLGESLIVSCEAHDDYWTSVTWRIGQKSVNQSVQHCYDFDINNSTCIIPSLRDYKKQRVRSRLLISQICERYVILNSNLDIPIVDWTDNGTSYRCVSRTTEFDNNEFEAEVYVNVIVG